MRKIFLIGFLLATSFTASAETLLATDNAESKVTAVNNLDVDRLMGRWYEIARLPAYFEKHCLAPIIIEYVRGDDEIFINNSCATVSGEKNTSNGKAYLNESNLNGDGKLIATTMPFWLRWMHLGRSDYWVIYADYLYSIVATPDRKYLWIYSRQETPPLQDIQNLISLAQKQGFDATTMIFNYPSYYVK